MKLQLDTVSQPIKGKLATRVLRAVRGGKVVAHDPNGDAFVTSILAELRGATRKQSKASRA